MWLGALEAKVVIVFALYRAYKWLKIDSELVLV
jgi:hypothetical protein